MWTHKITYGVGGLENIGFAPEKDLLIVLSSQGQGVFDCITGNKVARESNGYDWWNKFDDETNSIEGFDILKGIKIETFGLNGGDNLSKKTKDSWSLIATLPEPDDKPFEEYLVRRVYLISPDKKEKIFVGKDAACELRAFGFSSTGKSFVIATSCDLIIYSRIVDRIP